MSNENQLPRSPVTRVSIDGSKIKFLRESKGLTQLYIATFLGVTADTVSRWENRRYPTVKWENVEKLAEALDVDTSEILDHSVREQEEGPPEKQAENPSPLEKTGFRKSLVILSILFVIGLLGAIVLLNKQQTGTSSISAVRYLPRHIPAGQSFPVVVRVNSSTDQPFSFILQEQLPQGFVLLKGVPEIASKDSEENHVKWISNSQHSPFFLAYLVKASPDSGASGKVTFKGQIKADKAPRFHQDVGGESVLEISNFHWVDSNSDGTISDEEILMVYSSADVLKQLGIDMESIKKIWSAGEYKWDTDTQAFQVVQ